MLKKNIAKAMAAATVFTAAAPMANVVFADVIDSNQEQEIKELKAKVLEKFNTKYVADPNLLVGGTTDADQKVYKVEITVPGGKAEECTNYADFEKKFDEAFAKLTSEQKITITYTSLKKANVLEDGTVVNAEESKYTDVHTEVASDSAVNAFANILGFEAKTEKLDDNTKYAKVQISNDTETDEMRFITVKDKDTRLDLSKPKFRVVDGYYVNASGRSIKKYDETVLVNDVLVQELKDLGGVVDGYYSQLDQTNTKILVKTDAIVKDKATIENVDYTVADLYEVSTGRFTKTGNELVKLIKSQIKDYLAGSYNEANDTEHVDIFVNMKNGDRYRFDGTKFDDLGSSTNLTIDQMLGKIDSIKNVEFGFKTKKKGQDNTKWNTVGTVTVTGVRNAGIEKVFYLIKDIATGTQTTLDIETKAGLDRYETAVEASKAWTTAPNVVLVSGANESLVDGLTATPLAAALDAPVLLTKKDEIPQVVIDQIKELKTSTVYVVGGAVSDNVINTLKRVYGLEVVQIAGEDRYETSLKVAEKMIAIDKDNTNYPTVSGVVNAKNQKLDEVFIVGGKGEADALSVSAIAGMKKAPILLTRAGELDKDTKYFLKSNMEDIVANDTKYTDVYVVGGETSVSNDVQNALVDMKLEVERLAGEGRQETNAKVISRFATDNTLTGTSNSVEKVIVAKSNNAGLVDALAAGALGAKEKAHIVLATNELTEAQEDALVKVDKSKNVSKKIQAGYGIAEAVAKFIKGL